MKASVKWIVAAMVAALLLAGAMRALSSRSAAQQALQAQLQLQKQQTPVEIAATDVLQAQTLELSQTLALSGALKAVHTAFLKAKVAGELSGLTLREGDFVTAGQVVGKIDSSDYAARVRQARQQADAAKAQVDMAQRTLDNNRALVDQGFISQTALATSLNALAAAQATYQSLQAGSEIASKALADTVLRAPISGQVAQRLAHNTERVGVDARVLEIVDIRTLELEAALSAADSTQVQVGQTASLHIDGLAQPVSARVVRINPSTVSGSRAVLTYLALEPLAGLRQGLFAHGRLSVGSVRALAVPREAVRTDKPQPYVQQVLDGKVVHQVVSLGASGEHKGVAMVALTGLSEGAQLLAAGAGALRNGTPVQLLAGKP